MGSDYQLTPSALAELGAIAVLVCFESVENEFDAAVTSGIFAASIRWKAKQLGYANQVLEKLPENMWLLALKKRPDLVGYSAVFIKSSSEAIASTKKNFDGSDLQGKFWRRFASRELVSTSENDYLAATALILMKLEAEYTRKATG